MQIEEFNQYVKDHIKEYLPLEYETEKVSIQEVTKSNDRMLSGLTILREGENFSPTVYLEPFAEQVAQGRSLEDTLREITKIQTVHHAHIPVNISTFMDYAETGGTERTIRRYLYGRDHGNVPVTCAFALWKDNKFFASKKKTITKSVAVALLK